MKAISRTTTLPAQAGGFNGVFQFVLDFVNLLNEALGLFANLGALFGDKDNSG